jgi:hypothetical protein
MARGAKKYPIPEHFVALGISQELFGRWLDRITNAHIIRDRKRTKSKISAAVYRQAIYRAVCDGGDRDYYTGERLNWKLLRYFSKIDDASRDQRLVPSVDHEGFDTEAPVFRICSLQTNKCKSDYSIEQLLEFCETLIKHQKQRS